MEIPLLPPDGLEAPQIDNFQVWTEEYDHPVLFKDGKGITFNEPQIALNGLHLGLLHLETTCDGHITYIDGIDFREGAERDLSDEQWNGIVLQLYAGGITQARRVEHPGGRSLFLEAL